MPLSENALELANGPNIAIIATKNPSGTLQVHPMWASTDGQHILLNTEVHRRKFKNIEVDPKVTVTIMDKDNPWRWSEIRGRVVQTIAGSEGRAHIDELARERNVPYFGICFGMQMACVEAARNLAGFPNATSTEFGEADEPVVGLMTEWMRGNELEQRGAATDLGGTMRLGAYDATLKAGSRIAEIYGATNISERHRHRYEVNMRYREHLEKAGLVFAGLSPDGLLPETVEYPNHPWFVGVQYHPELKSRPFDPHPLFKSFIAAAVEQSRLV